MKSIVITSNNNKYVYEVFEDGRVYDVNKKVFTTVTKNSSGYLQTYIHYNDIGRTWLVHRLVMSIFKPVENMKNLEVNHIDGNKLNNLVSNLEWCTSSENKIHAFSLGLMTQKGSHNVMSKLDEEKVEEICKMLMYESVKNIANKFDVTDKLIYQIRSHEIWTDITEKYTFSKLRKLDENQVTEICELLKLGYSTKDISEIYQVNKTTIDDIKYKKSWKNVTEHLL